MLREWRSIQGSCRKVISNATKAHVARLVAAIPLFLQLTAAGAVDRASIGVDDQFTTLGRQKERATTHELEAAITAALTGRPPAQKTVPAVSCPIAHLR
jgi:hypothetical protein